MVSDFLFVRLIVKIMNANKMPYNPNILDIIINSNLYHLIPFINSGSVINNADVSVIAITIIIIGDTIPAATAASPNIRAPTIDRELVVKFGSLKSHSFNISNDNTIIIASMNALNGTDSL